MYGNAMLSITGLCHNRELIRDYEIWWTDLRMNIVWYIFLNETPCLVLGIKSKQKGTIYIYIYIYIYPQSTYLTHLLNQPLRPTIRNILPIFSWHENRMKISMNKISALFLIKKLYVFFSPFPNYVERRRIARAEDFPLTCAPRIPSCSASGGLAFGPPQHNLWGGGYHPCKGPPPQLGVGSELKKSQDNFI